MPKDFAKKKAPSKKRGASRSNSNQKPPIALWFFTSLLTIGFAGGLVYLKWFKPSQSVTENDKKQVTGNRESAKSEKAKDPKAKQPLPQDSSEEIPLYDLHQDLIHKEVKISEEDLKLPDNINKFYYSMPCGSFREPHRAEELKAQIAMTGNNSSVESVSYQGETWYRVQLGPFSRKRAAESIRHRLQDNNIQGCIINRHLIKK